MHSGPGVQDIGQKNHESTVHAHSKSLTTQSLDICTIELNILKNMKYIPRGYCKMLKTQMLL